MNIIQINPNPSGAYQSVLEDVSYVPDGWQEITCDYSEFFNGFIIPTVENNKVTGFVCNTEAWNAWKTVPIEALRENKLNSLNGMCSGTIYQGVNIGTLHYNFTEKTQVNLETIARLINEGQITFLYRADNETEQRNYTAAEIKTIIKAKSEWITVNTNYYELLKKWINREEYETIISSIRYGSTLPNDLMTELATKLASVGIDITKYASLMA